MPLRNLTLHQLRIFTVLARHLNMTRAAEELHMTPAALSVQVKQMAESVGSPLHEQIGKKLYLTDTGRLVESACLDVLARLALLASDLDEACGLERGSLKLSIITVAKYFVPRRLAEFCKRHPAIEASLEVANRDQILERIRRNLDDLYVMGQAPGHLDLEVLPLMENPLVLVAPADHPLAGERGIDPQRLQGEAYVAREPGSGTRLAAERFFAERGVRLDTRLTLGSTEAIKQAVAGGMGLAVISRHALALDQASGAFAVLDVQGFPLPRRWFAVHHKGKRLSAPARAFLEFLTVPGAPPEA